MEYIENELPKCYKILFDAVEKAIDAINQKNYGIARTLLMQGQAQAENAFVEDGAEEPADSGETGLPTAAEV